MKSVTRRQFLKLLAAGSGAVIYNSILSGCATDATPQYPELQPETVEQATPTSESLPLDNVSVPTLPQETIPICSSQNDSPCETAAPAQQPLEPAQATVGNPDLVVARNAEPEELVRKALLALGGMERFVPKGSFVIIKPNICTDYYPYEYAATTNPWVIGSLVKLCIAAGAKKVQVMDFPFGGSAKSAYKKSGIQEQVEAANGEMIVMPEFMFIDTPIPLGKAIKSWMVYEDALKADVFINVPIAKHHSLARLTLGMKNLMGIVQNRSGLHPNLGQRLADLTSLVRPTLTVIDAVRILTDNGPTGGNLDDVKKLDTIIVSPDIVAADSYATTLFDMKPDDIAYIRAAAEMGLGSKDLNSLLITEL